MAKSSVAKNLQKIHTYAQDIEAVRGVTQTNAPTTSNQDVEIKESPKIVKADFTPTPTIKTVPKKEEKEEDEEHTELLVPQKPKLPAIRTMESDSKKIDQTKTITTAVESKVTKPKDLVATKTEDKKPEIFSDGETKKTVVYTKAPEIHLPTTKIDRPEEKTIEKDAITPAQAPKVSVPAAPPISQEKASQATPKKVTKLITPTKEGGTGKQTRDTTYSATVITDTKHKRFSLWGELKKKLNTLVKSKTAKKKVNYTTPTTPLRKGVVQSATTNTARKTIADYSSLKDRVKARQPEENIVEEKTTDTNMGSIEVPKDNSAEIEKTRFELLHSIEKEVGAVDNKLPDYLSPITKKQPDELPVFNRVVDKSDKPTASIDSTSWEHYTNDDVAETVAQTEIKNPTLDVVPAVDTLLPEEKIHVPVPIRTDREQSQAEKVEEVKTPAFNVAPVTPRILPTIPPAPTEIPDVDMSAVNEPAFTPIADEEETYTPNTTYQDGEVGNANEYEESPEQAFTSPEEVVYQTEDAGIAYEQPTENYQQDEQYVQEADTLTTPPQYFTQPKIEPTIPGWSAPEEINLQEQPTETQSQTPLEPVPAPMESAGRPIDLGETTVAVPSSNPIPRPAPKQSNRIISFITQYTQIFILGGLVAASVFVVGVIATTSLISYYSDKPTTTATHNYFNSSAVYPVIVSPLSSLTVTEQITRHNNAIGVSEVILQSGEAEAVSPAVLIPLLKLPLDPTFNASLLDIRFGWYREEPFVVIRYSGDLVARGALLQWERTMYADLLPLFGLTPVSPSMLSVFKDATVENKDVRVLYTASGGEELMYGIVAPGHVIMTTSEMSFLNLSSNFNPQ